MSDLLPVLLIGLVWLLIGLPLSKASRNAKQQKARASRQGVQPVPARNSVPGPAPAAPAPAENSFARPSSIAPTISVTEHDDSVYQGSMNAVTGEGCDPCHEEELGGLNAAAAAPVQAVSETHSLPFGWTGSDMVRGVVISEILKRKRL